MDENITLPRRVMLELLQGIERVDKLRAQQIRNLLKETNNLSESDTMRKHDNCPMTLDRKHLFEIIGMDQDRLNKRGDYIMKTRMVCTACGYCFELISQAYQKGDVGVPLVDSK